MELISITRPIHNIEDFKFKDYDYTFLKFYRIMFSFNNIRHNNSRRKLGIVTNINDGYVTFVTVKNVEEAIRKNKLKVYINRDSSGKLYFHSNSSQILSIDLSKIDMLLMKNITEEDKNGNKMDNDC